MQTHIPAPLLANPEWVDLYQRLQAFQVRSYEDVLLAFLHKLARMNGWSHVHTERVFSEYKRFLFLTVVAGHFVCPCEAVDQTWHFHLIYTESYWDDLCGKVLGKTLHHVPSRGGVAESNAFHREYAQTLASYERFFGEPPPADIWERPGERLRDTPHLRLVNTRTHWLLPRPAGLLGWVQGWLGKSLLGLGGVALSVTSSVQAAEPMPIPFDYPYPWWVWLFTLIPLMIVHSMVRAIMENPTRFFQGLAVLMFWGGGVIWLLYMFGPFGLVLVFLLGGAYTFWTDGRCPQCGIRHVFHATGIRSDDGKQAEYRCSQCGHVAWETVSQSSGEGGGGCSGGCGGSGGSGGG